MATVLSSPVEKESAEKPVAGGMARRDFIVQARNGLLLGFFMPGVSRLGMLQAAPATQLNSWLQIGSDGTISLTIGSAEMGQGSFSGLAQILAEELGVNYNSLQVVQGGPALVSPAPVGTSVPTFGSGVVRSNFWKFRQAGATAREMLVQAAMNANGDQNRSNYTVRNAVITYTPANQTYRYAQVASAAALLTPPATAPLTCDAELQYIGKTVPRLDIPAKVDGSAKYGIDIQLPKMLYAIIKHCPTFGGTLVSTPRVPAGMTAVISTKVVAGIGRGTELTGMVNAVAVVGPNTWDTWQAANGLHVQWTIPASSTNLNDATFVAQAQALIGASATPYTAAGPNPAGTLYTVEGSRAPALAAIQAAAKTLDSQYVYPYIAHACLEVLNCTVDYKAGVSCDIYAPHQYSQSILGLAQTLTGLPASAIQVHTTFLGGGLGRKIELDFVSQAIQVGMALGRPVKLMWPRSEDFTRGQYRPMALVHVQAGLDTNNNIVGWAYRNISPSILGQRGYPLGATGDSQGYEGSNELPYAFGNRVTEWVSHPSPIPVGFLRSVGGAINIFAIESMMDELAAAAGEDPYLFRLRRLTDPRWANVLEAAAALGNWSSPPPSGHYRGIAIGTSFNSIVAEVVEISNVTATDLRVNTVSVVVDCYLAVNPGQVESQIMGGVVHGINTTLYGKQTFVNGAAQGKNFSNSKMILGSAAPQVNISLIPNPAVADPNVAIGGIGEVGVPTLGPAMAAAYFKATGKRMRTLPFYPNARMDD